MHKSYFYRNCACFIFNSSVCHKEILNGNNAQTSRECRNQRLQLPPVPIAKVVNMKPQKRGHRKIVLQSNSPSTCLCHYTLKSGVHERINATEPRAFKVTSKGFIQTWLRPTTCRLYMHFDKHKKYNLSFSYTISFSILVYDKRMGQYLKQTKRVQFI